MANSALQENYREEQLDWQCTVRGQCQWDSQLVEFVDTILERTRRQVVIGYTGWIVGVSIKDVRILEFFKIIRVIEFFILTNSNKFE